MTRIVQKSLFLGLFLSWALGLAGAQGVMKSGASSSAKTTQKTAAQSKTTQTVQTTAPQSAKPASAQDVKFVENLSAALDKGDVNQALALFDKMGSGASPSLQTLHASLLLSAGRDSDAEKLAKDLLAANPKDLDVLSLNVMIAKKKGDVRTKSTLIRQILAIDQFNADANVELGGEQALKHNYRNARDYYKKALVREPQNTDALFGYGKMSYYMTKDNDAKSSFEKILEVDPDNAIAYAYLGKLEAEKNKYKEALSYIEKAIKLEPDNMEYYLDQGTYLRYLGKYKDTEKAWIKATQCNPDYFLGYAYLAGLYDEMNNAEKALEYYRKVVEKNPAYYYAYESLGIFAWHSGSWAEARAAFTKAYEKNPNNISYPLMIAATWWKEGNILEMKKFTEKVMKTQTDRKSLDHLMTRMYHDMGGETGVIVKIQGDIPATQRGKMLYYAALYYDLKGYKELAQKYYLEVAGMQAPQFFEFRLAQWSVDNAAKSE